MSSRPVRARKEGRKEEERGKGRKEGRGRREGKEGKEGQVRKQTPDNDKGASLLSLNRGFTNLKNG